MPPCRRGPTLSALVPGRGASAVIPIIGSTPRCDAAADSPTVVRRPDRTRRGQIICGPTLPRLPQPGLGDAGERHGDRVPEHRQDPDVAEYIALRGEQRLAGVTRPPV